ncbi:MAG: type I restriction-modification system subunit M [Akkermansia sp.]|nr:type I restriction-modification system subunit M [Akkermansia sp.]
MSAPNISSFIKRFRDIMRNDPGINGDAQRIEQIAWMLFLKVYAAKEEERAAREENFSSIIPEPCRWCNWAADNPDPARCPTGPALLDFVNNTLFPTLRSLPVTEKTPPAQAIVQAAFADAHNYMKDGVLLRRVLNLIDEIDFGDYTQSHAFADIYESLLKELQNAGTAGEFYTPRAVTDFMAEMIRPQLGETMADFACGTGGFITSWLKALQPAVKRADDFRLWADSFIGVEKKPFPFMLCLTNLLLHDAEAPRITHGNSLAHDVLDYTERDRVDVILMNPPYGGSEKADIKTHFPDDLASSETADLFMAVILYRLRRNGRAAVVLPDGFLFGSDTAKLTIKQRLLSEFNLHTIVRLPASVFAPYTSITTNILFFDATGPTKETWFYRLDMPQGYKHFSKTKPMRSEHFDPLRRWWKARTPLGDDAAPQARAFSAEQLAALGYNLDQCGFPHTEEEILPPRDLILRYREERASLNAEIDRVLAELQAKIGIDA